MKRSTAPFVTLGIVLQVFSVAPTGAKTIRSHSVSHLDLVSCGRMFTWTASENEPPVEISSVDKVPANAKWIGVVWDEQRDVAKVAALFKGEVHPDKFVVQYWFQYWPHDPPKMPTLEDREDDSWQGRWLTAKIKPGVERGNVSAEFLPLHKDENPAAGHLPGVSYRRSLKVRVSFGERLPEITAFKMLNGTRLEARTLRVQLGVDESPAVWRGSVRVSNGEILLARPALNLNEFTTNMDAVLSLDLDVAKPALPGAFDITMVKIQAQAEIDGKTVRRRFSFSPVDLEKGPIYIPDMHAYITRGDDLWPFSKSPVSERKIRARIPDEPEQSYERATREIPPQDPWEREHGDRVYLPVAADASWQKFAVEYGGRIFISKGGTKAKGAEKNRLQWKGDRISFRIGVSAPPKTGETRVPHPYYRDDRKAQVSVLDDHLPVIINRWEHDGLHYEQEAFATLLTGPLDPDDPKRSEQTPAVLMARLAITNPLNEPRNAIVTLDIDPAEKLLVEGRRVLADGNGDERYERPKLRAVIRSPAGKIVADPAEGSNVHCSMEIASAQRKELFLLIPFVSDVTGADADRLESLDYGQERRRVIEYWENMIARTTRFTTPEAKFNELARFVIPHIHISVTKDPASGLYMVPAASYGYQVYANEAVFQCMALDALGDTKRSQEYLETFMALQGTRTLPGNYVEPHDGIYHGARVNETYDYTAHHYSLDHGATLWALARHYFFSRDKAWLKHALPSMFKAVEWIEHQREQTKRQDLSGTNVVEYGLLPAGHLEDNSDWGYWFSVNAYCVAGMAEMARALVDIGDPRAEQLGKQAEAYHHDLRESVLRTAESNPVVRMRDGTYSPYVPTRAYQRFRGFGPLKGQYFSRYGKQLDGMPCFRLSGTREVLYGPTILLDTGIIEPDEPIADWILDDWEDNLTLSGPERFNVHGITDEALWFSQGGMVWQSNLQNPILAYLKRNETPAAIRNLYNNFVTCLYPDVNVFTEEYRQWSKASGPFYKSPDEARFVNRLRDMLVLESGDELWLASGAPRRWLATKDGIRVNGINSYFGEVKYTLAAGTEPNTIVADVQPVTRNKPAKLWLYLRIPDHKKIKTIEINGESASGWAADRERLLLPQGGKPVNVVIRY